jgi:hypothetical protein
MRKFIVTAATGISLLVVAAGLAVASPATGSTTVKATTVVVGMHDPGCHWFVVGMSPHRSYTKTHTVHGAVKLTNLDENTLIIAGPSGKVKDKVGQTKLLTTPGVYTITMVKQAPDDNHLKLTIK